MRKTDDERIGLILKDDRFDDVQRELVNKWYHHSKVFQKPQQLLDNAYTIREFALFIKKSFDKATIIDIEQYLQYKENIKEQTVTGNSKINAVKKASVISYKNRLIHFYRYLAKHTSLNIEQEIAYPKPKIVKSNETNITEKYSNRRKALLSNIVIPTTREDKRLTQEQLQDKYSIHLLKPHNLQILKDYYRYKTTSGIIQSDIGFIGKLAFLKRLGLHLDNKTYKEATRQDIEKFLESIKEKNGNINPSYKAHLLDFYRFIYEMFGNEQPRKYPDVVSWLYIGRKKINDRLVKAIITDKEILSLLAGCTQQRDRAIISVLRDSSARVGELTTAKIKDVKILEIEKGQSTHHIATIKLKGKTGERINQLYWSVSDLRLWLLNHPLKDNPEAPLFIALKENRYGQRLTAVGVNKILQKIAKKVGVKRHIHAHLFRHTNLTKMASLLSETELKIHAGWGANSNMAEVYVHLTIDDVNRKILKKLGLETEVEKQEDNLLQSAICPNIPCSFQNPGDSKFCQKCGYPLTLKTAIDLRRVKEEETRLQSQIIAKGTIGINIDGITDMKEIMYQIIKNDKEMIGQLAKIMKDSESLQ